MSRIGDFRSRLRLAESLPTLGRKVAWEGAKLAALLALREAVRRARAGPLLVRVRAPLAVAEGDHFLVDADVEAPYALVEMRAAFAASWQPASTLEAGARRERWAFRATTAGIRPLVVRARDAEGHVRVETRWIAVLPPQAAGALAAARRVEPITGGRDEAERVTRQA